MSAPSPAQMTRTLTWLSLVQAAVMRRHTHAETLTQAIALRRDWDALGPESRSLISLSREYPTRMNGAHFLDLPLLDAQAPPPRANFLDLLVQGAWRQTNNRSAWLDLIRWALSLGFSPTKHNGLISPVAAAAYGNQLDVLDVFRSAGADLVLLLEPSRIPPHLDQFTLLHRLVNPLVTMADDIQPETVAYLAQHAPGPNLSLALHDPEVTVQNRKILAAAMKKAKST